MIRAVFALALPLLAAWSWPTRPHPDVEEGLASYQRKEFAAALAKFDAAIEDLGASPELRFSQGTALFQMALLEPDGAARAQLLRQARLAFETGTGATNVTTRVAALYCLGTVQLHQQRYSESIDALRQALRIDPSHEDARYNLHLAMLRLGESKTNDTGGNQSATSAGQGASAPETAGQVAPPPVNVDEGSSAAGVRTRRVSQVEARLEALERRSRELQRAKARGRANTGQPTKGKTW